MDAERFEQLIEAYGARPERWPRAERAAGEALLARMPALAARLTEARRLDHALDAWKLGPAAAALGERIVAGAPRPLASRLGGRPARFWWVAAGLAAACATGVITGANLADLGLSSAQSVDSIGALIPTGDNMTVFGSTVDLGQSS
jgi:hypothetical protein